MAVLLSFYSPGINAYVFGPHQKQAMNLYLGSLDPDEETGVLENPSSNIAVGIAVSQQSRNHPHLAFDLELWLLYSEFANTLPPPLLVSLNDEMELETSAITVGVRLQSDNQTPYQFYLSGGYGYFYSSMRVYADIMGVTGYFDDTSSTFAPYLGAGFNYDLGRRQTLEIFYRKWMPEGDFSDFSIPETGLGGETVGLGFGYSW